MAERQPRYENPPIVEAVIDLRVKLPDGTPTKDLAGIFTRLTEPYGPTEHLYEDLTTVEFRPGPAPPVAQVQRTHVGFRAIRADRKRVLTARSNAFSYSALAPYDGWDVFRSEAQQLWELYRDTYRPEHVTRVATRYINRIDIPLSETPTRGLLELEDYFKTYPEISSELEEHTMGGFVIQVQVPQPSMASMLVINQAVVPPAQPDVFSVVLDLDLYREVQWDPQDDNRIWGFFQILRERKNKAFEASLTKRTKELFN
jgi:uncharacterized protein (TIGR04255 family)